MFMHLLEGFFRFEHFSTFSYIYRFYSISSPLRQALFKPSFRLKEGFGAGMGIKVPACMTEGLEGLFGGRPRGRCFGIPGDAWG